MTGPRDAIELESGTFSDSPATSATPVAIDSQSQRPADATSLDFSHLQKSFLHRALDPPSASSFGPTGLQDSTTSSGINLGSGSTKRYAPPSYQRQYFEEASYAIPCVASSSQAQYDTTASLFQPRVLTFTNSDNPACIWSKQQSAADPDHQQSQDPPITSSPEASHVKSVNASKQPAILRSALKRKAGSLGSSGPKVIGNKKSQDPGKRSGEPRTVSFMRMSGLGLGPTSRDEGTTPLDPAGTQSQGDAPPPTSRRGDQSTISIQPPGASDEGGQEQAPANRVSRTASTHPPSILPPERVFPIQIGSELFRLSGASISSDAPSYFTQFFEQQIREDADAGSIRTLYIDRDPATFRDVARHLQGYSIKPRDGSDFVKLYADAQFYSLPRLINQLFESEIFIQIGERDFQIPRDIFSEPGNSPNFFSLGFEIFFSGPGEVFPGLDRRGLLRPPAIAPPCVPGRSAETFSELLHLLRGYPLSIRNEVHRSELLRDCRYFHLRCLEQKIIAHEISYNLERQKHEICLRLEDIKPSGVSFHPDEGAVEGNLTGGWVYYARPFVDETSYEMVVEIGDECTVLDLSDMRADFHNLGKARVSSLFQVVANKMNLPTNTPLGLIMLSGPSSPSASPGHTPLSEDRVKVRFEPASDITLDGERLTIDWTSPQGYHLSHGSPPEKADADSESDKSAKYHQGSGSKKDSAQMDQRLSVEPPTKRRRTDKLSTVGGEWIIRTGLWRLRVQPSLQNVTRGRFEIVLTGVKIDAYSSERARNARRSFLS
ncbi:hypothetical protein DV736_g4884, partial [Chaetothyriales sp. CBS 134916]